MHDCFNSLPCLSTLQESLCFAECPFNAQTSCRGTYCSCRAFDSYACHIPRRSGCFLQCQLGQCGNFHSFISGSEDIQVQPDSSDDGRWCCKFGNPLPDDVEKGKILHSGWTFEWRKLQNATNSPSNTVIYIMNML